MIVLAQLMEDVDLTKAAFDKYDSLPEEDRPDEMICRINYLLKLVHRLMQLRKD